MSVRTEVIETSASHLPVHSTSLPDSHPRAAYLALQSTLYVSILISIHAGRLIEHSGQIKGLDWGMASMIEDLAGLPLAVWAFLPLCEHTEKLLRDLDFTAGDSVLWKVSHPDHGFLSLPPSKKTMDGDLSFSQLARELPTRAREHQPKLDEIPQSTARGGESHFPQSIRLLRKAGYKDSDLTTEMLVLHIF